MEIDKYTFEQAFNESVKYFDGDELAAKVRVSKYALKDSFGNIYELTPADMHRRLANEFARIENKYPNPSARRKSMNCLTDLNMWFLRGVLWPESAITFRPDRCQTASW